MSDSYCFIINTLSNKGKAGSLFSEKLEYVKGKFPESHYIFIDKGDAIQEQARKAAAGFKYVVAAGGDGTVQKVARGLVGTPAIMGVLPLGNGNDFAKSIGLTLQFEEDLNILLNRNAVSIDVIKSGDDLFLNMFGIGVDGLTNYYSAASSQTGILRYFISAIKGLFRSATFKYECVVDGKGIKGTSWMIVAANGPIEGGKYEVSPESINSDGVFEVVIIRDVSRMRLLVEFLKLSAGFPYSDNIVLKKRCASSMEITLTKAEYAHADGEIVDPSDHFRFSIVKRALPVITGE